MATLDDIMSERGEPAPAPQPEPQITDADRAANPIGISKAERDRQGRFAPKIEEKPQPGTDPKDGEGEQPQADPGQRRDGHVPQGALSAERGKRKEAESEAAALRRELAELRGTVQGMRQPQQPAPQPEQPAVPEIWSDPNAWAEHRVRSALDPVQQQIQGMRLAVSQRFAVQEHGQEVVQKAVQGLAELRQTNPAEFSRLEQQASNSMDPVGDVVRWHKQQTTLREVGTDPDAWRNAERERIRAELLAEMEGTDEPQSTPPAAQPPPRLPSSFAAARSGGPRGGQGYGGPKPLSELMPRG